MKNAVPPERKTPARVAPKLDPAKALIDAMLRLDLTAPRKQRHTARRVLARLVDEHQLTDLTYSAVRDYVAKCRPEIMAAGKAAEEARVPQTHEPGAEAEVHFADLWLDLAGVVGTAGDTFGSPCPLITRNGRSGTSTTWQSPGLGAYSAGNAFLMS